MDVSPSGGGIVKIDQTVPYSHPVVPRFSSGTSVRLEAVPASGYRFNNWTGDLSGTANPTTIVIDCHKRVTANFFQVVHTLTMEVSGSGSTTPTAGSHDYSKGSKGTVVSITATPDSGWRFDRWTGDVADVNSAVTTVTMDSDKTVTANFSQNRWPLVGGIIGGIVLVGLLVVALVVRRRMS